MKFPNEKRLAKVRKKLEKAEGSLALSPKATPLQRFRYDICRQFVIYQREHELKCKSIQSTILL